MKALPKALPALAAISALLFSAPAAARVNFDVYIGIPAPVYVHPYPVHVLPRVHYSSPRHYYHGRSYHHGYGRHHHYNKPAYRHHNPHHHNRHYRY